RGRWCQTVPAQFDELRPLRLVAGGHARHAVEERLLLHAPGVGDDRRCPGLEGNHLEVADGLADGHVRRHVPKRAQSLTGPWVDEPENRPSRSDFSEAIYDGTQSLWVVRVLGPMD